MTTDHLRQSPLCPLVQCFHFTMLRALGEWVIQWGPQTHRRVFPGNHSALIVLSLFHSLPPQPFLSSSLGVWTTWSECHAPACKGVSCACIFPALSTFIKKKKVLSLITHRTKRSSVLLVGSKARSQEWGHGHPMSTSFPLSQDGESHQHGCLPTLNLSPSPRCQPIGLWWGVEALALCSGAMILVNFLTKPSSAPVPCAPPWTYLGRALDWKRTQISIYLQPRSRWGSRHVSHAWGKVRIHDSSHGLFNLLQKWNKEASAGLGQKAAGKNIG